MGLLPGWRWVGAVAAWPMPNDTFVRSPAAFRQARWQRAAVGFSCRWCSDCRMSAGAGMVSGCALLADHASGSCTQAAPYLPETLAWQAFFLPGRCGGREDIFFICGIGIGEWGRHRGMYLCSNIVYFTRNNVTIRWNRERQYLTMHRSF